MFSYCQRLENRSHWGASQIRDKYIRRHTVVEVTYLRVLESRRPAAPVVVQVEDKVVERDLES
jgi:hypothetical protein